MPLFQYNSQQWLNTDYIETVDVFGPDIGVKMAGGREIRISGPARADFLERVLTNDTIELAMPDISHLPSMVAETHPVE